MVNHKLVDKLMRQMDLRAKLHQRRPYVSYTGTVSHLADIKLDRNVTPDTPNTAFVGNVTEFQSLRPQGVFVPGNGPV